MPDFLFEPVPYKEAIDFIKSKPIVYTDVLVLMGSWTKEHRLDWKASRT